MSGYSQSQTKLAMDPQSQTLLANTKAERDRYQLFLDINNAVVTHVAVRHVEMLESMRWRVEHS